MYNTYHHLSHYHTNLNTCPRRPTQRLYWLLLTMMYSLNRKAYVSTTQAMVLSILPHSLRRQQSARHATVQAVLCIYLRSVVTSDSARTGRN